MSDEQVRAWAMSADRWWRRTALIATVALNVKALSWALRSLVGVAPHRVRGFLVAHGDDVPALVRREVGHKLETGLKRGR
ncbi:MAG TPA: hypothetical protein VLA36_01530 [Longimicrobiales bacterium]|nr:hypothetical protein [Longimicrobiales bacterium]